MSMSERINWTESTQAFTIEDQSGEAVAFTAAGTGVVVSIGDDAAVYVSREALTMAARRLGCRV